MLIIVILAKRIHLCIKGLTIISFTNQEKRVLEPDSTNVL